MKRIFLLLTCFMIVDAYALNCIKCRKKIHGTYIKHEKGNFCSEKCYASIAPKCAKCKKPCLKNTVSMANKIFCSQKCLHAVFKCNVCQKGLNQAKTLENSAGRKAVFCEKCVSLPSCYFCSLPSNLKPLADGRVICKRCRSTAVSNSQEIRKLFDEIRSNMADLYDYDPTHKIELNIVDVKTMQEVAKNTYSPAGSRIMALMSYSTKREITRYGDGREEISIQAEICKIYVLRHSPRDNLIDSIVHELTHDHIRHNVGKVKNLADEEGFCELAAALYNQKIGNGFLNKSKKNNPEPVYGGGYRKMMDVYNRKRSFKKTLEYLKQLQK